MTLQAVPVERSAPTILTTALLPSGQKASATKFNLHRPAGPKLLLTLFSIRVVRGQCRIFCAESRSELQGGYFG
jgi:hypothetical protein